MSLAALFEAHKDTLDKALDACRTRSFFSPFVESPSSKIHGTDKVRAGKEAFEAHLGTSFDLEQPGTVGRTGFEVSPYTQEPLGIDYPRIDVDMMMEAASKAMQSFAHTTADERAGLCLEMAFAFDSHSFENAHATMHTAGQSYLMAFSGSGANAIDRGVEALAYAYKALKDVPTEAEWEKSFGATGVVKLKKTYRTVSRGVAAVICCATFPLWNAYPAIFANLMTGNPVVLKPHPNGILPVAIAVKKARDLLMQHDLDPNMVTMAADTRAEPITIDLLKHDAVQIIDYTGSQRFGTWIEDNFATKLVYTETAGCNGVVIESLKDVDDMLQGLANALCGFSAQMCTSPQNIHIPATGVKTPDGTLSYEDVRDLIVGKVQKNIATPRQCAGLCATIQADETLTLLSDVRAAAQKAGQVLLDSAPYEHPDFPKARTATPLIVEVPASDTSLYDQEHFGPISFIIKEETSEAALANAANMVRDHGAISSYAYSYDPDYLAAAQNAFADAGASLWCNMTGRMPINFAAAYSDYHVTGMNKAGNACLADLAFVASRFRIIQFREPI
ncbi:phenylacetic acid degradation oxidoreductase [Kordiimonas sediminis]|uniref:Phenylacetic acid degradation oxidoreductase n=1 Tax=Kordiimonas sediminis TaxID=1735581 RepID=A0A919E416_9PROT|nr:phenylacetic acid degradation protein PaaN [Kordiimonas sediminis]GHF17571.1 phenylacetic acid degradation oxidoreductase [Kordiimonas sediminis]